MRERKNCLILLQNPQKKKRKKKTKKTHFSIHRYFFWEEALVDGGLGGIKVIWNEVGKPSSNPRQGCFVFHCTLIPLIKGYESISFLPRMYK